MWPGASAKRNVTWAGPSSNVCAAASWMSRWKRRNARTAPRTSPALANVYSTSD
ncbi:hypothetical protein WMF27_16740 [Sorangium sp. So ce281]